MGVVSRPRANPAMWRSVARYWRYRGFESIEEENLERVLAPASVVSSRGSGSTWKDSLDLAEELGLLTREAGTVEAVSEEWPALASDDLAEFQAALRRVLLAASNNSDLWGSQDEKWSSNESREFSRIAVWFLQCPVRDSFGADAASLALKHVAGPSDAKLIENPEQWRVFVRWALASGLIDRVGKGYVPDPSAAVAFELRNVYSSAAERPSLAVRDALVERIPVLEGGEYFSGFGSFMRDDGARVEPGSNLAGVGLSIALERLRKAGHIDYREKSDGDRLVLSVGELHPTDLKWRN